MLTESDKNKVIFPREFCQCLGRNLREEDVDKPVADTCCECVSVAADLHGLDIIRTYILVQSYYWGV